MHIASSVATSSSRRWARRRVACKEYREDGGDTTRSGSRIRENLPKNVVPSGAVVLGPRRSLRPGVLLPSASSQTGRKAKTSFEERKTKAPCDRRPSRARIHGATWFHRLCQPRISLLLCPEPLRGGASPPSRSICDVAGYYDFPPGTVAAIRLSHVTPGDSNCTCCMYSYAPLSRSFKVFAAVRQSSIGYGSTGNHD